MAAKTALQNGSAAASGAHNAQLQGQKAAVALKRRKTISKKAEDEGLLASLCMLISHHQIGMVTH
jgi:acyl-CoA-dependent ceramide synthase